MTVDEVAAGEARGRKWAGLQEECEELLTRVRAARDELARSPGAREGSLAVTDLETAGFWLGQAGLHTSGDG